ncbi:MAG: hypothetical protein ACMUEM_03430 [Flavobacteriales bacterium AspAUS03]
MKEKLEEIRGVNYREPEYLKWLLEVGNTHFSLELYPNKLMIIIQIDLSREVVWRYLTLRFDIAQTAVKFERKEKENLLISYAADLFIISAFHRERRVEERLSQIHIKYKLSIAAQSHTISLYWLVVEYEKHVSAKDNSTNTMIFKELINRFYQ